MCPRAKWDVNQGQCGGWALVPLACQAQLGRSCGWWAGRLAWQLAFHVWSV